MPVKNAGVFLRDTLVSIQRQTFQNWELLAVNDHSDDDSLIILKEYAEVDSRIKVLDNQLQGIIHALRMAYRHAKGVYITRMDADDLMATDKLELLSEVLDRSGTSHVAVGCVRYFAEQPVGDGYKKYAQWLNRLTKGETNFSEVYKECVIPSPCWMIHRQDLDDCGAFHFDTYPEDYDLCFRFYQSGYRIAGVNQIIHHWRDHPNRSSRTDPNYSDNRFLTLKVDYFSKVDYRPALPLVLWGAGKKGKNIAQLLIKKNIRFNWFTNNVNKIGHDIYGVIIESPDLLSTIGSCDILIAVANPDEQRDLLRHINVVNESNRVYLFC